MKKLLCVLMVGMMFGQTKLETRVYEISSLTIQPNEAYNIDMFELTGYSLNRAILEIYEVEYSPMSQTQLYLESNSFVTGFYEDEANWSYEFANLYGNGYRIHKENTVVYSTTEYFGENIVRLRLDTIGSSPFSGNISILVRAEFPQEDTGYIEEGFDYCLHTGANLVSAPCRNVVPIEDAIPLEIAQNITGIITEGGAASNMNGMWVGSLSGVGGGKGYWILSDMEGCFNYTCSEN